MTSIPRILKKSPGLLISTLIILLFFYHLLTNSTISIRNEPKPISTNDFSIHSNEEALNKEPDVPFMPKMANETLKAELGNSAWKLLHTILARYPEEPTAIQKKYLETYIESFAQVYPCGDCARHFIKLLKKFPPQLNSRKNAALWGCFIHNKVNERLNKEIYDCSTILEDYDCGCGSDEVENDNTLDGKSIKDIESDSSRIGELENKQHLESIKIESKEENIGG